MIELNIINDGYYRGRFAVTINSEDISNNDLSSFQTALEYYTVYTRYVVIDVRNAGVAQVMSLLNYVDKRTDIMLILVLGTTDLARVVDFKAACKNVLKMITIHTSVPFELRFLPRNVRSEIIYTAGRSRLCDVKTITNFAYQMRASQVYIVWSNSRFNERQFLDSLKRIKMKKEVVVQGYSKGG